MARDRGGDTLKQSTKFSVGLKPTVLRDVIGGGDRDDLLRTRLRSSSTLSLNLNKLKENANLEIYALKGKARRALKAIGDREFSSLRRNDINRYLSRVGQSKRRGTQSEAIDVDLEAGIYYIRVFSRSNDGTRYRLKAGTTPIVPTDPGVDMPGSNPLPGTDNPNPLPGTDNPTNPPSEPPARTETVLYSGVGLPSNGGWLEIGQFPISTDYVNANPTLAAAADFFDVPTAPPAIETVGPNGVTLDTRLFPGGDQNEGYVGYSNYTLPDPTTIGISDLLDPEGLSLELVNPAFPAILDNAAGYSIEFDLALLSESSSPNRAGFSVTVIGSNGQGIELGFKSDRIFAQSADFTEAETEIPSGYSLGDLVTYRLSIDGSGYQLFANNTLVLNGALRSYNFDPTMSDPQLPFNPYEFSNLLFFGDNTDQGYSTFTLGEVSLFT